MAAFAASVCLGLAVSGCAFFTFGPTVGVRHLTDNPIDQAILTYQEAIFAKEARRRLMKRLPPGTPTIEARKYLASIGAKCRFAPATKGPMICSYSQYVISGFRSGLIYEENQRRQYDFTIRLLPGHGPLRDVAVCETTRIFDLTDSKQKGTEDEDGLHAICTH